MANLYRNLNADKALLWRIVHRQNLPWILANGLHAAHGAAQAPDWVGIGNRDLIARRGREVVPLVPGGVLNDYVPFYFTPFSPMLYNIHTGRGGVPQVANADIVILVSSLHAVAEAGLAFVFTDRHACLVTTQYYNRLDQLDKVDWPLLQRRDFQRDANDPEKMDRYQAEALIHQYMPVSALLGAICHTADIQQQLQREAASQEVDLTVHCRPGWYF
jgi:hypothetical protein